MGAPPASASFLKPGARQQPNATSRALMGLRYSSGMAAGDMYVGIADKNCWHTVGEQFSRLIIWVNRAASEWGQVCLAWLLPHGCRQCPQSVTTSTGKVRGAQGLRVVDASIFPQVPCANMHFPTIKCAERIADAIFAGRWPGKAGQSQIATSSLAAWYQR